ncbi:DUF3857 domain-containing protein [Rhodoflexus sp.]
MTSRTSTFLFGCSLLLCLQLSHNSMADASSFRGVLGAILFSKPTARITTGALTTRGVFEDETYDWQEKRSLTGIPFNPAYSDAVIINERRVLEYAQQGDEKMYLYETVHKIIRINNREAIGRFNKVRIPLADVNHVITLKARTIHPSGTITEVTQQEIRSLQNVENTGAYLIFALEGLESGSEIEYIYQVRRDPSFFGRVTFEIPVPVWQLEFEIITPEHLIFEAKSYNHFPDLRMLALRYPGKHSLYARLEQALQINEKVRQSHLMRVDYKLAYNTLKSNKPLYTWDDMARAVRATIYDFEAVSEEDINRLYKHSTAIIGKASKEEDQIKAIIDYVSRNIRIIPDQEHLHESPISAIDTHIGGRMDIIRLYALLFTMADIPHRVLVTADRNRMGFDRDFATLFSLEEFIFHFTQSDRYFAPIHTEYGLGIIPAALQGNQALVVAPPFDEWEEPIIEQLIENLPISDFLQSIDQNCLYLQADEEMDNLTAYWERSLSGHLAILLRRWHRNADADEFSAIMQKVVQYHVPQATITGLSWEESTLANNLPGMTIRVGLKANSLLEYAGESRLLRIGRMVETSIRNHSPDYPFGRHYQIRLQLPEGWQLKNMDELNKSATLKQDNTIYAHFSASGQMEGSTLVITVEEYFPEVVIPESMTAQYQQVKNCATAFGYVTLVIQKAE